MRFPLLLALAIATPVAAAPTGPGGPDDPASPASPVVATGLPPLFEPALRAEDADAVERSDVARPEKGAAAPDPQPGRDPNAGGRR
jgi:hypothetical protein